MTPRNQHQPLRDHSHHSRCRLAVHRGEPTRPTRACCALSVDWTRRPGGSPRERRITASGPKAFISGNWWRVRLSEGSPDQRELVRVRDADDLPLVVERAAEHIDDKHLHSTPSEASNDSRMLIGLAAAGVLGTILLGTSVRIVNELRTRRHPPSRSSVRAKGSGLFFIVPIIDGMLKVNLQTITTDIPPPDVITTDTTLRVNAVTYIMWSTL